MTHLMKASKEKPFDFPGVAEEFRWALHSGGRCGDDTIDTAAALSVGVQGSEFAKSIVTESLCTKTCLEESAHRNYFKRREVCSAGHEMTNAHGKDLTRAQTFIRLGGPAAAGLPLWFASLRC